MSFFVGSIAIACTTYDNGYYGNNGRVYRAPDGGTYRSGQIYRDRNGNVYRDGRIYRYGGNDTYGYGGYRNGKKLPPGQAKKIYGGSAKDYAPGQQKKYYKNNHHYKNKKYKKNKKYYDRYDD